MRWDELGAQNCSVSRALAVLGDRWTMLLLRDAFVGVRRFEAFQARLGISRTIVADRLARLVEDGVLERRAYQERPVRHEYRLTAKGRALHPVMLSIVAWGDAFYAGPGGPPVLHRHRACGCDFRPVLTCSACAGAIGPRDVDVRPGPGAAAESTPRYRAPSA